MIFFFDANLSQKLVQAINLLDEECNVMHLTDKFAQDEKDEIWLQYVGKQDMILVTRDTKIRKHPAEIAAIKSHRVGAFFLLGKKYTKWQGIRQLICAWEEMKRLGLITHKPFAFQVTIGGRIKGFNI